VQYLSHIYDELDVTLTADDAVGESYYNDMLDDVVADLDKAGLLVESDGALCVFPPGFTNRENEPLPLIVKKRDDGYGYAATDLAAVRDRVSNLHADELLYVVGTPQAQHLDMVYAWPAWLDGCPRTFDVNTCLWSRARSRPQDVQNPQR